MKKNELIEQLKNEIENLKGGLNSISVDFYDDKKHYLNETNYICDEISEFADSNVDIYTSDLFEWCKTNYEYIEQSVAEFGIDEKNFDFIRLIQQGQYLEKQQSLYDDIDDLIKMFAFYQLKNDILELSDEEIEIIEKNFDFDEFVCDVENLDSNNYFDDIVDLVIESINKALDKDE